MWVASSFMGVSEPAGLGRVAEVCAVQSFRKKAQIGTQFFEYSLASLGRRAPSGAGQFAHVDQLHSIEQRQRQAFFGGTTDGSLAAGEFANMFAQSRQLKCDGARVGFVH